MTAAAPVRVAAIGLDHAHIVGQTEAVLAAGAELVAVHGDSAQQVAAYRQRFVQAQAVDDMRRILEGRAAFYSKADLTIDTSGSSLEESLQQLRTGVRKLMTARPG